MEQQMRWDWKKHLYFVTIIFFALGFFNILFAWLGFVCMVFPFVLLIKHRKKIWCQNYCPRVKLFGALFSNRSLTGKAGPAWLTRGKVKWYVMGYFVLNLIVLIMSTIMVLNGKVEPIENVRFLFAFKLPWNMPDLLELNGFPGWSVHLAFRVYSMMLTTTVMGFVLAWVFKPRTWCTVCPINTTSDLILTKIK